jgi:small subunit ribosomal protein S9
MADDEQRKTPDEPAEGPEAPESEGPEAPESEGPEAPEGEGREAREAPEAEGAEGPEAPEGAETPETPAEGPEAREPAEDTEAAPEPPRRPRRRRGQASEKDEEVIPGEHLEPDLVLEQEQAEEGAAVAELPAEEPKAEPEPERPVEPEPTPEPVAREPVDLAADARYHATGKRKRSVARVILKPGSGAYAVNGRALEEAFPRHALQRLARQPLEAAGYEARMDVVARIHGGGVASQASALRHGVARALVEADPNLRMELKRRGYLTRDPRVKERKKAGLKKARKRPQFSKR